MVTTTHSIHCGSTSGSHEQPPTAAAVAAKGEHCIVVWLGQPKLVLCTIVYDYDCMPP